MDGIHLKECERKLVAEINSKAVMRQMTLLILVHTRRGQLFVLVICIHSPNCNLFLLEELDGRTRE
ncbi:unnamed protein product [Prunus brigantina]